MGSLWRGEGYIDHVVKNAIYKKKPKTVIFYYYQFKWMLHMHAHKCRKYGKILLLILQKLQTKIVEDEQLLKILNGNCDELYIVLETI